MYKAPIILVLLTAAAPALAQDNSGKMVFTQKCAVCHYDPAKPDVQPRIGPSLKGVVGRKAASAPGFARYSPAMKRSGKVWNKPTLDAYLTAPAKVVPGTTMSFAGLSDAGKRAAIINYLTAPK